MFNCEIQPPSERLADAIQFRQKGGDYWYPDTLTDRNAIRLSKITYKPAKDPDEVLRQFSGVCFCQFNTPPLGRRHAGQSDDRQKNHAGCAGEQLHLKLENRKETFDTVTPAW